MTTRRHTLTLLMFISLYGIASTLHAYDVRFTATPPPETVEQRTSTYTSSELIVTQESGKTTKHPLRYNILFTNKDKIGDNPYPAGQYYDVKGKPRYDSHGKPVISEAPDGNSLLIIEDKPYLITHFEYDWLDSASLLAQNSIMSMALTELSQTKEGKLKAIRQRNIDTSTVNGIHVPCFASQTPWNTHLASEENYYFDALPGSPRSSTLKDNITRDYFNNTRSARAYHYGLIPEVSIDENGNTNIVKHYAMGRGAWEMALVLPDRKTVYLGNDGAYKPLIMFVADKPGDLSAGTLYAARWNQTSAKHGGSATLTWIWLGRSSNQRLQTLSNTLHFNDIFSFSQKPSAQHIKIKTSTTRPLFLAVNKDMQEAAAFLETERYAALRGATTEFNKMEGLAFNAQDNTLYIAMSSINDGMLKNKGVDDHIQLDKIISGAIYALDMKTNVKDSENRSINSKYVAASMRTLITGKDIKKDDFGNTAAIDHIANPDNIFYDDQLQTLFISEDSKQHINNFLWAYSTRHKQLTRILTLTAGAESSGLQVSPAINNKRYIMSNTQHHGEKLDRLPILLRNEITPLIDKFTAYVGYLSGIPDLKPQKIRLISLNKSCMMVKFSPTIC